MKRVVEPLVWAIAIVALSTAALGEGRRRAELERRVPMTSRELYQSLAHSQVRWQIVDARVESDEFEDAHVPGAIPLPACDPARATPAARDHVVASAPTVIVTASGAAKDAEACLARFRSARLLDGGMAAWSSAKLPEDVGEYTPPSAKAGGGCL